MGKVQALGRVVIPKDLRDVLSIFEGDLVEVNIVKVTRIEGPASLDDESVRTLEEIRIELGRLGIHFARREYSSADLRQYGKTVDKIADLVSKASSKRGTKHAC